MANYYIKILALQIRTEMQVKNNNDIPFPKLTKLF